MSCLKTDTPQFNISKETTKNSDKMCRVCMSTRSQNMLPIFGLDRKDTFDDRIMRCADVKIQRDDGLPTLICLECASLLKSAMLFRDWCEYSDHVLRELFADSVEKTQSVEIKKEICEEKGFIEDVNDDSLSHQNDCLDADDSSLPKKENEIPVKKEIAIQNSCFMDSKNEDDNDKDSIVKKSPLIAVADRPKRIRRTRGEILTGVPLASSPQKRRAQLVICEVCGELRQEHSLKDHMLIHLGALPFQCTLCPHRSRLAWSLKIHMRAHAGERPFSCAECPRKFLTSSNRKKHLLTHQQEKPFKCNVCEKTFSYKHTLEDHAATTHVGYKRHQCHICDDRFQSRKCLYKHRRKKH